MFGWILLCIVSLVVLVFTLSKIAKNHTQEDFESLPLEFAPSETTDVETPVQADQVAVNINLFIKTYLSDIPEDTFADLLNKQLAGETNAYMPRAIYESVKNNREKYERQNATYDAINSLRNEGAELEQQGNPGFAAAKYEAAIRMALRENLSVNCWLHAAERLTIIYRKKKWLEDENRIIKVALSNINGCNPKLQSWFEARKTKVEQLISKANEYPAPTNN